MVQRFDDGVAMVSGAKMINHVEALAPMHETCKLCFGTTDEAKAKALISQSKLLEFGQSSNFTI